MTEKLRCRHLFSFSHNCLHMSRSGSSERLCSVSDFIMSSEVRHDHDPRAEDRCMKKKVSRALLRIGSVFKAMAFWCKYLGGCALFLYREYKGNGYILQWTRSPATYYVPTRYRSSTTTITANYWHQCYVTLCTRRRSKKLFRSGGRWAGRTGDVNEKRRG